MMLLLNGLIDKENIGSLFNLLRGQDWWFYKIPPLLAIAYAEILTQDISPHPSFTTLLALTISMFFVAAYGHVVNDSFDIEVDKKAGKPNRIASFSRGQRTGLSLGLAVLGLVPWWWIGFNATSSILLAAIYLLLTVYPAPPLRLKERFILGAVADAATVHAVPALLVATVFSNLTVPSSPGNNFFGIIATTWAFAVGIRGILLHQIWDRDNDLKSGIQTLATKSGVGTLRFWINSIIFPLEAILSSALALVITQSAPLFLVPCAAYCLMLLLIVQDEFNPSPPEKSYIVLHDFYEVWLPLSLLILLSLHQPVFLILLAVHIVLFYSAIQQRVLVWICQIKLNLVKMTFFQSPKTVDITSNQTQPKTFLSQPANDLEQSLVRAIKFLTNNQLEDGEFPTYEDADEKLSKFDSSPFATSLILYSLSFLMPDDSENKVKYLIDQGLQFLCQEMEFGGLWRYWSSKNPKHPTIPPDLDDITCISYVLRANNISFTDNTGLILSNQNKAGAFYTWILPRSSIRSTLLNIITLGKALSSSEVFWTTTKKSDICCAVNSNILLYLGERKETKNCIKYLIEIIQKGKEYENTEFYLHNLSFYYMLSRAYYNGVKSLSLVKSLVIHKVLAFQQSDGSFGDELLTAFGVCTLLNFNYVSPRIDKAIDFILRTQRLDGDWKRIAMFGGKTTQHFFGSEALTTGFCVEALARYRLLDMTGHIQQSQTDLQELQTQLQQTEQNLTQSQSELSISQTELAKIKSDLQQTQEQFEQIQAQLQQTEKELTQSQSKLHTTQNELIQSQSELQTSQTELAQLKSYLQQTQGVEGLMSYYHFCIASNPDDIQLYHQALIIKPDDAQSLWQLGNALVRQNRFDDAISSYQTALQFQPDNFEIHLALGKALEKEQKWDDAIASYRRAIELNPDYSRSHKHLGDILAERGQINEASLSYRRALQLQPRIF